MSFETLIYIAIGLFVPAAAAGATMAILHWRARVPPWKLTILHGLLALGGLANLLTAVAGRSTIGSIHAIALLFVLIALGGIIVVSFHVRRRRPPLPLIAIHGTGAVTAFVLLVLYVLHVIPE